MRAATTPLRWLVAGASVALALWVPAAAISLEPTGDGAARGLALQIEIEQVLLEQDLKRYATQAGRRGTVVDRLRALHAVLDDAVRAGDENVATLLREVQRVEAERGEAIGAERILIERIGARRQRIAAIEARLEELGREERPERGALSGTWDVVLLPLEQRGVFVLQQQGTLLVGTYKLEGGWTGSLQGTLIDRKVHLVRIDSKLGRSMEFEGRLSGDGTRVRGDWLSFELAGGADAQGQWSAQRRPPGDAER